MGLVCLLTVGNAFKVKLADRCVVGIIGKERA